ncbi:MAG: OmpA family protein [Polyangiaceae bacterium]
MKQAPLIAALTGAGLLMGIGAFVGGEVGAARKRLDQPASAAVVETATEQAGVADHAEASYCTNAFKDVLRRVVEACGLAGQDARRGCEPVDVRAFNSISDEDFNALFDPLVERGSILLFDDNSEKLDDGAKKLLEERWHERHGARYFFIVARASKRGTADYNQKLSQKRANSVFFQLEEIEKNPEEPLDNLVGLLWLGSQYAQLSKDYCSTWKLSRPGKACNVEAINRSAFVSWVDCRL